MKYFCDQVTCSQFFPIILHIFHSHKWPCSVGVWFRCIFPFFCCLFSARWTQVNVNRPVIWPGMKWKSATWTVDKMHLMRYYQTILVTVCGWWVSVFVVLISSVSRASSVLMLPFVPWVIYGSSATLWSKSIGHCRYRVMIRFVFNADVNVQAVVLTKLGCRTDVWKDGPIT